MIFKRLITGLLCWGVTGILTLSRADIIDFAKFEQYVVKSMAEWDVPGAAVVIVKDGKVVFLKGFGTKAIHEKDPVTPETIFPLASLTKTFTVMVVAKLVEEGKLQWDDKVRKYYPEFKIADETASDEFTIRDLLSHRSGLPGFALDTFLELGWSEAETLQVLDKIPLTHSFRQAYDYQNIFPGIAGIIIERVTGKPLSEVYQTYLFRPLEMTQTTIGDKGLTGGEDVLTRVKAWWHSWNSNMTKQHQPVDGKAVVIPQGNATLYKFAASRGINSNAQDLAKWLTFLLDNDQKLIKTELIAETRRPHINVGPPQGGRLFPKERVPDIDYGMGWFIHKYDQINLLSHMGGMTGVRSIIAVCPQHNVGIIIVSNMGGMRVSLLPEALRSKFFDMYLNLPERDWSQELVTEFKQSRQKQEQSRLLVRLKNPLPAQDLSRYVGAYSHGLYGKIEISLEQGHLALKYRHLPKVALTHWNGDNFSFKAYELTAAYSGNDYGDVAFGFDGKASQAYGLAVNLFHEGPDTLFKRVE
jgi:CubicO group peptidase (beta-lactamase class C family)